MMVIQLIAAALAVVSPLQQDTTLSVRDGVRLEVYNQRGSVQITTWSRDQVRVEWDAERGMRVPVRLIGSRLRVRSERIRGGPREVDIQLTIPTWMSVEVSGTFNDVSMDGVGGEVVVETTQGDIDIRGGRGLVVLRSVHGEIELSEASGRIRVNTINGDLYLADIEGDLEAETLNGDVELVNLRSRDVSVNTMNGDVDYDGTIEDGGRYGFETHNGDVTLFVSRDVNATVSISTARGEFESQCPVRISGIRGGREFSFTVGDGSAQVDIRSFGGTIELRSRDGCWPNPR